MIHNFISRYDLAIWIRAFGNGLTAMTAGMLIPFLTLYLYNDLGKSLILAAVIVSLQPITDIILNIFFNGISDKYGHKKLMLYALILQMTAMVGLGLATKWWLVAICVMVNGAGRFLFIPAANAQIADVVSDNRRAEVFGLLGTAKSIGGLLGPIVGVFLYSIQPGFVFGTAAVALGLYFFAILKWIPETHIKSGGTSLFEISPSFRYRDHGGLFLMMVCTIPLSFLFAQMETNWPVFLKMNFHDYLRMFAIIETVGALSFIFLELLLAKVTERWSIKYVMPLSYSLFIIAAIGFAFTLNLYAYIVWEVLLCTGAILAFNHLQKKVSMFAPGRHRGRYFSIYGAHWDISRGAGPTLGALIISTIGGRNLFLVAVFLLIAGGVFQTLLMWKLEKPAADMSRVIND